MAGMMKSQSSVLSLTLTMMPAAEASSRRFRLTRSSPEHPKTITQPLRSPAVSAVAWWLNSKVLARFDNSSPSWGATMVRSDPARNNRSALRAADTPLPTIRVRFPLTSRKIGRWSILCPLRLSKSLLRNPVSHGSAPKGSGTFINVHHGKAITFTYVYAQNPHTVFVGDVFQRDFLSIRCSEMVQPGYLGVNHLPPSPNAISSFHSQLRGVSR